MKTSMLQTLDNREVGILQFNILSDQSNLDWLDRSINLCDETFPLREIYIAFNAKNFTRNSIETLFVQDEWEFIDVASVSSIDDRFRINVAHMRNLALQATAERFLATTHDDVGLNTSRTKFCDAVLCGLCLLLTTWTNEWHQRDVQVTHIVTARFVTELANGL